MDIQITCSLCANTLTLSVPASGFARWQGGERIVQAMPTLPAEDRELLISHTCPDCWSKLFPAGTEEAEIPKTC